MFLGEKPSHDALLHHVLDDVRQNAFSGHGASTLVAPVPAQDGDPAGFIVASNAAIPQSGSDPDAIVDRIDAMTRVSAPLPPRGHPREEVCYACLPILRALSTHLEIIVVVGDAVCFGNYYRDRHRWIVCGPDVITSDQRKWHRDYPLRLFARLDPTILGDAAFDHGRARAELRGIAAVIPGFRALMPRREKPDIVALEDAEIVEESEGVAGFLEQVVSFPWIHRPFRIQATTGRPGHVIPPLKFDFAVAWDTPITGSFSWGNALPTVDGSHTLAVMESLRAHGLHDVPHHFAISVVVDDPHYSNARQTHFTAPGVRAAIREHLDVGLRRLLQNESVAWAIEQARRRERDRRERDRIET